MAGFVVIALAGGPAAFDTGVGVASSSPISIGPFSASSFSIALIAAREPLLTAALMLFKSCGRWMSDLYPGASRSVSGFANIPASLCEVISFRSSKLVLPNVLETMTMFGSECCVALRGILAG